LLQKWINKMKIHFHKFSLPKIIFDHFLEKKHYVPRTCVPSHWGVRPKKKWKTNCYSETIQTAFLPGAVFIFQQWTGWLIYINIMQHYSKGNDDSIRHFDWKSMSNGIVFFFFCNDLYSSNKVAANVTGLKYIGYKYYRTGSRISLSECELTPNVWADRHQLLKSPKIRIYCGFSHGKPLKYFSSLSPFISLFPHPHEMKNQCTRTHWMMMKRNAIPAVQSWPLWPGMRGATSFQFSRRALRHTTHHKRKEKNGKEPGFPANIWHPG
jgi:hypothetical protein